MNRVEKSRTDLFFRWLHRINAVAIFALLIFFGVSAALSEYGAYHYQSNYAPDSDRFGHDKADAESDYKADEYETPDGVVHVYYYGQQPDMDRGEVSTGVTLIDPVSGRQLKILPEGKDQVLASFDVIENDENRSVAYLARISTKEGYAKGHARLVVGSLTSFEQVEIASNAPYIDAKVLTADNRLALVYWPNEKSARMVTIKLSDLSIERAEQIELPPPMSLKAMSSGRTAQARVAAVENVEIAAQATEDAIR